MNRLPFILFAVLLVTSCASNGSASFDATLTDDQASCVDEIFPFAPVFVAARERGGAFGLFFQSDGGNFQDTDVLYFEVFDIAAAERGDPIPFSIPGTVGAAAIGEIELAGVCPDHTESYYLGGQVVFDAFDPTPRGEIRGSIAGEIYRFRDRAEVANNLSGDFELILRRGPPYEEFISN